MGYWPRSQNGARLSLGSYIHGSDTLAALSTSSTSFVDMHASLVVTGIVPSTGALLIKARGYVHAETSRYEHWNLRTAAGTDVADTSRVAGFSSQGDNGWVHIEWELTGLTPGATFEYRLGWRASGNTVYIASGPGYGPIQIAAYVHEVSA